MKKHVVIIGGGFAGAICARTLQSAFDVTLIDSKEYFEFTPSVLRTIIHPSLARRIQVNHKEYLKKARVIKAMVDEISEKEVMVQGRKIPFDYLVVATGSSYNTPIKAEGMVLTGRVDMLKRSHNELESAQKVIIVGGGLVGVELAGEILEAYPDKKVSMFQPGGKILERNSKKAQEYARKLLVDKGLAIVPEKIVKNTKKTFTSESGKAHSADIAFLCVGIKPNSGPLKKHFSSKISDRGHVMVNESLQLKGYENIFVPGDVNDLRVEKTAQEAELQAKHVAKNIRRLEQGKDPVSYAVRRHWMVISLGKWHGILTDGKMTITGKIPAFLKWFIERKFLLWDL